MSAAALGHLADWEFVEYEQGHGPAAIAALHGTEIHFAIAPAYRHRLMFRERIREFLSPLFEARGFLTTRVHRASATQETYAFITRLGFELTDADEATDYFMLSTLPYERN